MAPVLSCEICKQTFNKRFNLKRHLVNIHKTVNKNSTKQNTSFTCTICKERNNSYNEYEKHIFTVHDIVIAKETLVFPNSTEFYQWKGKIEDSDTQSLVQRTSKKCLPNNCYALYFQCNRSGVYRPSVLDSERKRELKFQGSCKIDGFCPARIKAKFLEDGKVIIDYCSTHVGHKAELSHVPLSFKDRQDIASKLADQIPFDAVLEGVRSTLTDKNLQRKHLLTKHDLYNIESEFGLNSDSVRHSNDAMSVDAWVELNKQLDNNCILFYKPQGQEKGPFKKDDFALGFMTSAQEEMLKKFGTDCICMDGTHGMNAYDFEVVTLMVIDDMRQGFPCAFFISNRTDSVSLGIFLTEVKNKVGSIQAKTFMSDMAESFYNAWKDVMSPVERRLYCTWHVDRAWKNNLPKIKNTDKQKEVYKKLRTLQQETDEGTFLAIIDPIVQQLIDDEDTREYGIYFMTTYRQCPKQWAYCYRMHAGINTNMHLERMHRTIKYLFLKGKHVKRLDKAIHAIMQMIKQKLFDRLTVLEKGKLSTKVKELRRRHKESSKMNPDLVISSGTGTWEVASASSVSVGLRTTYTIRLVEESCDCRIVCSQCSTCMHKYSCTCIDASIRWNMCKHIHLLCRKLRSSLTDKDCTDITSSSPQKLTVEIDKNYEEKISIVQEVSRPARSESDTSFENLKLQLRQKFDHVLEKITTPDELRMANILVKNLNARIQTEKKCCRPKPAVKGKCNVNKKIQPQRSFRSTKKKRKIEKTNKRPTIEESNVIALQALLHNPPSQDDQGW